MDAISVREHNKNEITDKTQWEKFRKVNGKYKPRIVPLLNREGNIITSPDKITDTFADHYANIE